MSTFEVKAKRLLKESGLSYREVGEKMGYHPDSARQMVYRFLLGRNPSAAAVAKFAKALGKQVEEVL